MTLKAVESKRLYQQVAEQVATLIRQGHWVTGDRLPSERDMAQQLGVSRPTVREAILALEISGLVEVRTGAGIYVVGTTPVAAPMLLEEDHGPSPFELMDARLVIEGETAAIAAERITDEGLVGLSEAIQKMENDASLGRQDVSNRDDGDRLFHTRIAAASGNTVLVNIVDQLWEGMRRPMFRSICERVRLPANVWHAAQDHKIIYERLAAHDPEGSREAMRLHLMQVKGVLMDNGDESS